EGEFVELELEAADHGQQGAHGNTWYEEADPAGDHRLQLARVAGEAQRRPGGLDEALAALRGVGLRRPLPAADGEYDADIGDGVDGEEQEDADQAQQHLADHRTDRAG